MDVHLFYSPGARSNSCQCAIREAVALGTAGSEYVHKVCLFAVRNHCSSVSDILMYLCICITPRKGLIIPVNKEFSKLKCQIALIKNCQVLLVQYLLSHLKLLLCLFSVMLFQIVRTKWIRLFPLDSSIMVV